MESKEMESQTRKRVIFADGNPAVLKTAGRILEETGHELQTASSGMEVLCLVVRQPPNFIFIAAECPKLDAFQVCALLKNNKNYRHIPLHILAGSPGSEIRVKAQALGAASVVTKPFGRAELLALLDSKAGKGK